MLQPLRVGDEFGFLLKATRIHLGKTQAEVANAAQITQAVLSMIETGKRKPSLELIVQLCRAIGVTCYIGLKVGTENDSFSTGGSTKFGPDSNIGGPAGPTSNPPIIR